MSQLTQNEINKHLQRDILFQYQNHISLEVVEPSNSLIITRIPSSGRDSFWNKPNSVKGGIFQNKRNHHSHDVILTPCGNSLPKTNMESTDHASRAREI
ncbi:hypothetical protein CEXT_133831 [Caerostris extrusa]|uniref:Uncharacterized protein n=1 Tax=Caerostris extrusa TaxID=172846 RepID=A0AAV4V7R9_CAEEX|nr:hypothetical protein CEXT_133831 [Caerostris extrusa]